MDERSRDSHATTSRSSAGDAVRPLEFFAAGKEQPLSLVVLVDVSISMESRVKRSAIRDEVERRFPLLLAPARSSASRRVRAADLDRPAVCRQLESLPDRGPQDARPALMRRLSALHESGMRWTMRSRRWSQSEGRRAVLLVTDGQATGNRDGPQEVAPRAVAAGVAVSVVG